jgi:2'-5' RNA ligase
VGTHTASSGEKPHISLAVFDRLDVQSAQQKLSSFAKNNHAFPLTLLNLGVFPGVENVLFLSPSWSGELLELHRKFHDLFASSTSEEWPYYKTDSWVPHCTLEEKVALAPLKEGLDLCSKINLPISVSVEEVGLVGFQPLRRLCSFKLSEP